MFRLSQFGPLALTAVGALFVAMAPAQGALIVGQISGFGSAGTVIGQTKVDFLDPLGPPDGTWQAGANPANATGSYAGLHNQTGTVLDFNASGFGIGLANFIQLGTFQFTLQSTAAGSNYGGQNVWQFSDIPGGVFASMVLYGTVTDTANPGNSGVFQATYTTQFQSTTAALILATLNGGTSLPLQSYSVSIESGATINPELGSSVPEPGSWAMLLTGLGLVGAGLRSRRRS